MYWRVHDGVHGNALARRPLNFGMRITSGAPLYIDKSDSLCLFLLLLLDWSAGNIYSCSTQSFYGAMKYILNTFRRDESDDIIISKLGRTKNSSIQRKKKKRKTKLRIIFVPILSPFNSKHLLSNNTYQTSIQYVRTPYNFSIYNPISSEKSNAPPSPIKSFQENSKKYRMRGHVRHVYIPRWRTGTN